MPQGGDHGVAVADAVPEQAAVGGGVGGELMQPAGEAAAWQRDPHPALVDLGIPGGQVPQHGAALGGAERVFSAEPRLSCGRLRRNALRGGGRASTKHHETYPNVMISR